MKVKLDENMPAAMAELLREAGHEVATVAGEGLSGADDSAVIRAAATEARIVITFDVGFGNITLF